jgi:hypothetical protein
LAPGKEAKARPGSSMRGPSPRGVLRPSKDVPPPAKRAPGIVKRPVRRSFRHGGMSGCFENGIEHVAPGTDRHPRILQRRKHAEPLCLLGVAQTQGMAQQPDRTEQFAEALPVPGGTEATRS